MMRLVIVADMKASRPKVGFNCPRFVQLSEKLIAGQLTAIAASFTNRAV
jgi:hypothetical protein